MIKILLTLATTAYLITCAAFGQGKSFTLLHLYQPWTILIIGSLFITIFTVGKVIEKDNLRVVKENEIGKLRSPTNLQLTEEEVKVVHSMRNDLK